MKTPYSVNLNRTESQLEIKDNINGGVLYIKHVISKEYENVLQETPVDHLEELHKEIQTSLKDKSLSLSIFGKLNILYFHDDFHILLKGEVLLQYVTIKNPSISNSSLCYVSMECTKGVLFEGCTFDWFASFLDGEVIFNSCTVDDYNCLNEDVVDNSKFVDNKRVN